MSKFEAGMEAMLDTFVFETSSLLEELDSILLRTEQNPLESDDIAEIFRCMHTIKGSAAMMGLQNMSTLAHSIEDLFYIIREDCSVQFDKPAMYNLLFNASDCLKNEIDILGDETAKLTDFTGLMTEIRSFADNMKNVHTDNQNETNSFDISQVFADDEPDNLITVKITLDDDCMMPTIRAMVIVKSLGHIAQVCSSIPQDFDSEGADKNIMANGLYLKLITDDMPAVLETCKGCINVKTAQQIERPAKSINSESENVTADVTVNIPEATTVKPEIKKQVSEKSCGIMSVRLEKLDRLLDLVGEIVISESAVSSNPDLKNVTTNLDSFNKSARELKKLTDELQDVVMSIRMVPVRSAFSKMNRVVRDMNKKLWKNVTLIFDGEDTEVDKSIIDILNDPLMHIVRNAMDHGIESAQERALAGKTQPATVTLSAGYDSGEVIISCRDNGGGMDRTKLLAKAKKNGILTKPENEYSDDEAYNLVMEAGFSTNEAITEFSGRGVGMDVVRKNIESVGGKVIVNSVFGEGSTFTIKIPLSLSIIDVMEIQVGEWEFSVPISSIVEVFKATDEELVDDINSNEMIIHRGKCLHCMRLSDIFEISGSSQKLTDGIMLLCAEGDRLACYFADKLIGDIQVVVKPFSPLLSQYKLKSKGLAGCSILADGSITLILNMKKLINGDSRTQLQSRKDDDDEH